jgi:uncharacterized membrane protein YcaP (DUF421 family)
MDFLPPDWLPIFEPDLPLLELIVRGSVLYLVIVAFMRVMPRRTGGELAMMDLIFLVLIAEAAAHALGDFTSIADGIVMIATLMGWNYLLNFSSFHVRLIEGLVSAPPLPVVQEGQLMRRNMWREFLTEEELLTRLREQGYESLDRVKTAYVEGDGKISVIGRAEESRPGSTA